MRLRYRIRGNVSGVALAAQISRGVDARGVRHRASPRKVRTQPFFARRTIIVWLRHEFGEPWQIRQRTGSLESTRNGRSRLETIASWVKRVIQLSSRIEIALLAISVALAGAIWAFLKLGSEMREGEFARFDLALLSALRMPGDMHRATGPHWLLESMRDITALGGVSVLTLITLIGATILLAHRRTIQTLVLLVCVPLARLSTALFKDLYDRPRPSFAIYGDLPMSMSFPSGHSTAATATYFVLAVIVASLEPRPSMKALAFAVAAMLALLIGFSRVYLGVHWPSDVIAGWFLGSAWALVAAVWLRTWQRRTSQSRSSPTV